MPRRSEEHTSELQSQSNLVCRLLLEKKNLSGNWGVSIHTHQPVLSDLSGAAPASLALVTAALIIALVVAVPLGLLSARWPGRASDHFFFNDSAPTEIYTLPYTTLFRSRRPRSPR